MSLITSPTRENIIEQACAVAFRRKAGAVEFCLITSSAGRWKFPKGYVEEGETFVDAALKEAEEEAGIHGTIIGESLGCYEIEKKGRPCTVIAFLMKVTQCDKKWKESAKRKRRWVTVDDACQLVSERDIEELLLAATSRISKL